MAKETDEGSCDLDKLKEKYEKFRIKYDLPQFFELNKLFDIEETCIETDFLLRRIRRIIGDRITAYSRFAEVILNPNNAPIFFFKLIKKLETKDREILNEVYEALGKLEFEVLNLDLDYDEKKESDFIKKTFELFSNDIRQKLLGIIKKLSNEDNGDKKESSRSYFG